MSITHRINGRAFTVETYWLAECGPRAFQLVYSIDGIKVTKAQFIDELCHTTAASYPHGIPGHADVPPDAGPTGGD